MTPFIVIAGTERCDPRTAYDLIAESRALGLETVVETDLVVVLSRGSAPPTVIYGGEGVVFGSLFSRSPSAPDVKSEAFAARIKHTGGRTLIDDCWGSYIAVIADASRRRVSVIRDPSGAATCFRALHAGVHIYASDVELLSALGVVSRAIDWGQVAHQLAFDGLRTRRTCLMDVDELLPGTRDTIAADGSVETDNLWSPWTFASQQVQFRDRQCAAAELGAVVRQTVSTWVSGHRTVMLELSGGLDSSVVAACLIGTGVGVVAATLATNDLASDERHYAKLVSDHIGAKHVVMTLDDANIDITQLPQKRYARPASRVLGRIADAAFSRLGADERVDAFLGGDGGDCVFGYLGTSAPVADVLRAKGPGTEFVRAARDLAVMFRSTMWRSARLGVAKALTREHLLWRKHSMFLAPDAAATCLRPHPWLNPPANAWPGKIEQVRGLIIGYDGHDQKSRASIAPVRSPLLSQPVIETCLQIPSWMNVAGGRNRAVARDAFAAALPPEILSRSTKGNFRGFNGRIYERNRTKLHAMLTGGLLARNGLLDLPAIDAYLQSDRPTRDMFFSRLLRFGCAESWARAWESASHSDAGAARSASRRQRKYCADFHGAGST